MYTGGLDVPNTIATSTMSQAFVFKSLKVAILTAFRHEHVYARGLGVASAARVVPRITERGVAHGQA